MERKVYIIIPHSKKHWQEIIEILLSNGFVFNFPYRMKSVKEVLEGGFKWPTHPNFLIGYRQKETDCKMIVYNCSDISGLDLTITIEDFVKDILPTW